MRELKKGEHYQSKGEKATDIINRLDITKDEIRAAWEKLSEPKEEVHSLFIEI